VKTEKLHKELTSRFVWPHCAYIVRHVRAKFFVWMQRFHSGNDRKVLRRTFPLVRCPAHGYRIATHRFRRALSRGTFISECQPNCNRHKFNSIVITELCVTVLVKSWRSFRFVVLPSSAYSQQVSRLFIFTWSQTHTTVGRTRDRSVAEASTWQHTTLTRDKHPCPPVGCEPTIPASAWPQTYALDGAAAGIG
jgi:hypothetical protein